MMPGPPTSVLSDGTILELVEAGRIRIEPWDAGLVQPASVDLRLGDSFRVFHNHRASAIDLRRPPENLTEEVVVPEEESFVIHPGEFCLGRTLEWVELPHDIVARIEGKALSIDTLVPTPDGWRTMGDLAPGDVVFDIDGHPTPVVAVSHVTTGRPCRAVDFSDGTTVVADLDHQWQVWTKHDRTGRGRPSIRTTAEIERTLKYSATEYNHHVAQALAVEYPWRELPIDPYVLGAWLGDGTSTKAEITSADQEILDELVLAGEPVHAASGPLQYRVGGTGHTRDQGTGRYVANESLNSRLRALGVMGHKHIPRPYLESSVEQRRALLEGIMDTDGYVDVYSRCDVTTVSARLAEDYRELIASLGYKPVVAQKTATLYGKVCGMRYEVQFKPHERVFRLPRKVARQKLLQRFHHGRAITGVRACESVPVRCIEVGSPDGVFLVSRSFIPTHNSSLGRLGLIVHATAGFCDPGWKGTLTLELNNLTRVPIKLYPGLPIAQLSFMTLDRPAQKPYGSPGLGSHYQGQRAATESRYEGGPGEA
ncbi:MAG TPA: LAGLIDADG family homing endonuclease [Solirubrobacteraceae bacterium]|nr:LAGLIDADG family homing endonuclease [Solirubrobacteraceae bacterium]